jgi:sulfur relay (sulfurtransferase) complex TusBCD TusD component (DsrE family)|tara:strand:- start:39 stop:401 length:363 start_codon:yes stop_codon:yes gene_type:complete
MVGMDKNLTILLNRGPFVSEYADLALKMAIKAREKGYGVNLYLYVDGVWAPHIKSQKPFANVGQRLRDALALGVNVKVCNRCADARDVVSGDVIEGIPLVGLFDFTEWLHSSDRVLTFTG